MDQSLPKRASLTRLLSVLAACGMLAAGPAGAQNATPSGWPARLEAARTAWKSEANAEKSTQAAEDLEDEFTVENDWVRQDSGDGLLSWIRCDDPAVRVRQWTEKALAEAGAGQEVLRTECQRLAAVPETPPADWLALYARVCEARRDLRLRAVRERAPRLVFTQHATIRPSFFAYTEGQSDAQAESHFLPGSKLCLLDVTGPRGVVSILLDDPKGAIRDPAVSWDGTRVLFAWKKSHHEDDYHLYEMEAATKKIRQITSGLGVADFEPAYLPNDDIIFSSSRCVQTVDCWWTEVSNLYTCDPEGRRLRRLGFDQVHTVFPNVLDDGRVIYTRWDYNDRGQVFPQGLFQMNPDGTGQSEFYGNNSWFPTTTTHARGIPGSSKVVAILCGHHTTQAGKLAVIDPTRGRQENTGVQLVAPVRETKADRIDAYGQDGELWQYPYPLNEREFVVTYAPSGWDQQGRANRRRGDAAFALYWMDIDGKRELLASDPKTPCQQAVPLVPRPRPPARPSSVDYRKDTGTCYIKDIYQGPGLANVPRGSIRKLRVVALGYRAAGVGSNGSGGPGGGALISTPVAVGNGTWDQKIVLGEAQVYPDGSAFFILPARTPVYFQAIDADGRAAQTMRSWMTLQPGENQSCVGCHESRNSSPVAVDPGFSMALRAGAQPLAPFQGPARGFSFPQEIQPILDKHCVSCHNDPNQSPKVEHVHSLVVNHANPQPEKMRPHQEVAAAVAARVKEENFGGQVKPAFSLRANEVIDEGAKRRWSEAYLNLTGAMGKDGGNGAYRGTFDGRIVNWIGSQSIPGPLPPYAAGSCRSELIPLLEAGHGGARLSREEIERLACWIDLYVPFCGTYTEAAAWTEAETAKYKRYQDKRDRLADEEKQRIAEWLGESAGR